jgi:hypothetical protein
MMRSMQVTTWGLALLFSFCINSARAANLKDPAFLAELDRQTAHAAAFGVACVDSSGQLRQGPTPVTRVIDGLPIDLIDCTAEWRYADGVMYVVGHLLTYPTTSYATWEDYRMHRDASKEPHPQTYAEAWAAIEKLRAQAEVPAWTPDFGKPRCQAEVRFEATELPLPRFVPSATPPAVPPVLKSVTFMRALEAILNGPASCADQRSRIQSLFAQATVTDARDWAWISWAARHPSLLLGERMTRLYIGALSQMAHLHPIRDHDGFATESFLGPVLTREQFQASLIRLNLAVDGTEKDALEQVAPGKSFGDFARLSRADQERWRDLVAFEPTGLTALFADPTAREERGTRFRKACDSKLATIFGGPNDQVAGSGYEMPFPGDTIHPEEFPRWHVFSNLHIYDGGRGDPLFVPPGGSPLSGGQDENACFVTYYTRFGNYGPTRLVTCHVSHAGKTSNTNAMGSVEIGHIGGPGGSGDGGYSHSHLILYSSDRSVRLNFVDAFCR